VSATMMARSSVDSPNRSVDASGAAGWHEIGRTWRAEPDTKGSEPHSEVPVCAIWRPSDHGRRTVDLRGWLSAGMVDRWILARTDWIASALRS
jgi:hypothetical protein